MYLWLFVISVIVIGPGIVIFRGVDVSDWFFFHSVTKNSSLAAAIAYPDLVLVFAGTALMQTGKAIEIVSITMLTYLTISLTIAAIMNWYNKKIEIKEK